MSVPRHREVFRSPLHDWRVAAAPQSGIAGGIRRRETPFVGRTALLRLIDETLDRIRTDRHVIVRLVGEAGIGKTRLLREIARRGLARGLDVRSFDDSAGVRLQTGSPGPPSQNAESPGGLSIVRAVPRHDEATPARLILVDLNARYGRLHELTESIFDAEPAIPTIVFLAVSASVGSCQPGEHRVLSALARQRMLHELEIPPLEASELFELASFVLDGPPQMRLFQTVDALSDGHPLLAEEVAWDLRRSGFIGHQHGSSFLLRDVPETYVPAVIASRVNSEVDSLDSDLIETLSAAAVLGRAFEFEVIASALPMSDEQILRHLEVGIDYGILRESSDASSDFAFTHELVRRVLYRRISQIRRRSLHQAMAEALERVAVPTDQHARDTPLAYHFTRGFDTGRALDYVLRAQANAENGRVWDQAIRYCREAWDLARRTEGGRVTLQIDLLEQLGALYFGQAETFATGASWREALHLCEQVGGVVRRAALTARLAALGPSWCSMDEAESAVQTALDSFDSAGAEREPDAATWLFDALHELGLAYQRLGRIPDAVGLLGRASGMADPDDWPRWALARVSLASALIGAGRSSEAVDLLRTAVTTLDSGAVERLERRHQRNHLRDPRRIRCLALGHLVRALAYLGDLDEAARLAETVVELERQFGMLGGRGQRSLAQVELALGRPGRAVAVLAERLRQSAAGSLSAHRVADLLLLAEAYLDRGDPNLAWETANDGINLIERTGAREHHAGLHLIVARALLARGEVEAARSTVVLARQAIAETGADAYLDVALSVEEACKAATVIRAAGDSAGALTSREREVLALMADGRTNRQIADVLVLSDKTVKRHLSNMFAKLGVGTRAAAVRCAFKSGML